MFCGCCCDDSGDDGVKTPLLGGKRSQSTGTGSAVTQQPYIAQSARTNRPQPKTETQSKLKPRVMTVRPVKVAEVDKRLSDHMALYNEHVESWQNLQDAVTELRALFPEHNPQKTARGAFAHIRHLLGDGVDGIKVQRRQQFCLQIEHEDLALDPSVVRALATFNRANKQIKIILDKGPTLVQTIIMVVENEKELRREILVASLGAEGPDCMKNCIENVNDLKKVPLVIEDIRHGAIDVFEELKAACQLLFRDQSDND